MIDLRLAPYGALLLRVSMGVLFILHGVYLKAMVFGMAGCPSGSHGSSCSTRPSAG